MVVLLGVSQRLPISGLRQLILPIGQEKKHQPVLSIRAPQEMVTPAAPLNLRQRRFNI